MKLYDISGEQFSAMDAPRHLMTEEGTAQTTLDRSLGICQVAELEGKVTREVLEEVMEEDCERLLIRGDAQITRDGADYLAEKKLVLLGVEQETVDATMRFDPESKKFYHIVQFPMQEERKNRS